MWVYIGTATLILLVVHIKLGFLAYHQDQRYVFWSWPRTWKKGDSLMPLWSYLFPPFIGAAAQIKYGYHNKPIPEEAYNSAPGSYGDNYVSIAERYRHE